MPILDPLWQRLPQPRLLQLLQRQQRVLSLQPQQRQPPHLQLLHLLKNPKFSLISSG